MTRLRWIAMSAVCAAVVHACSYPTFTYGTSTGDTGATGNGGSGGTGGASTSSSSSSSSSSSTSTSSSSTGGPKPCQPLHDAMDCGAGMRCTVVDENFGKFGCKPIGTPTKKVREACVDDKLCPAGTFCDRRSYTCAPLCNGASSCAAKCVAAEGSTHATIPAVSVCTARCDPMSATSCGPGALCAYDSMAIDFDCFATSGSLGNTTKMPGEACSFINDCPPTYVCAGDCLAWCAPAGDFSSDCPGGYCEQFANLTPVYNGVTYGYCPP